MKGLRGGSFLQKSLLHNTGKSPNLVSDTNSFLEECSGNFSSLSHCFNSFVRDGDISLSDTHGSRHFSFFKITLRGNQEILVWSVLCARETENFKLEDFPFLSCAEKPF